MDTFGIIRTIVGTGVAGFSGDGHNADSAEIDLPENIVTNVCGNLYIADFGNLRVRKVALNPYCWAESIQNITTTHTINIYPNPAYNELTITTTDKINTVTIYNLIGQTVYTQQYNNETAKVNIAALPEGMYMVEVTGTDGNRIIKKIIKQ